jgi:hypothetical protein
MARKAAMLVFLLCVVAGCDPYSRDVTANKVYRDDFDLNGLYALRSDVSLVQGTVDRWKTGTRYYLAPPRWPPGIEAGDHAIADIPAGTRVRVQRLILFHVVDQPYHWKQMVRPVAVLTDGPHSGTQVDIAKICKHFIGRDRPSADLVSISQNYLGPFSTPRSQ